MSPIRVFIIPFMNSESPEIKKHYFSIYLGRNPFYEAKYEGRRKLDNDRNNRAHFKKKKVRFDYSKY